MGSWSHSPRILFVSQCGAATRDLALAFREDGFEISESRSVAPALEVLSRETHHVVVLLTSGQGEDGVGTLVRARTSEYPFEFIVVDDHARDDVARRLRGLAVAYLTRPLDLPTLRSAVHEALRRLDSRRLSARRSQRSLGGHGSAIVGESEAMARVHDLVERISSVGVPVLLTGETGTGKDLVARAIHRLSPRRRRPFVPVSCAAVPEHLVESTLFGHMRGSFTGAVGDHRGLLEQADGGTVLLDDVESIGPELQAKLLRMVEDGTIQRVGGRHDIALDFRLISATNVDLSEKVREGTFRKDLFYRLNVFPIHLPPLRERPEDIPLLAFHFRDAFALAHGLERLEIPRCCMEWLVDHPWPGNVRELKHTVERAMVLSQGEPHITCQSLAHLWSRSMPTSWATPLSEEWTLARLEHEYTAQVLRRTGGHKGKAARILGIDRRTLYRKLRHRRGDLLGRESGWGDEDESCD